MTRLPFAAVFCGALALVGCGGQGASRPQHASAKVEGAWVEKLTAWFEVEASQGTFRKCRADVAERVGSAPSRDTEALADVVLALCELTQRWHKDEDEALKTHDADTYWRSRQELDQVDRAVKAVSEAILTYRPGVGSLELGVATGVRDDSRIEPTFGKVATAIAGTDVKVRCWAAADWKRQDAVASALRGVRIDAAGFASFVDQTAELAPEVCRTLAEFVYGEERPSDERLAAAIAVLAHEATHLSRTPVDNEAVTECYAMQRMRETALRLGADAALARRLASLQWQWYRARPVGEYVTRACRKGGPLDQGNDTGPWD